MPLTTQPIFTFLLATFIYLGAFSRFTHGQYTPWFYAYQEYHQVDDGSATAKIIPFMDIGVASLILWSRTRSIGITLALTFFCFGIVAQYMAGKRFEVDLLTVNLCLLAAAEKGRKEKDEGVTAFEGHQRAGEATAAVAEAMGLVSIRQSKERERRGGGGERERERRRGRNGLQRLCECSGPPFDQNKSPSP